MNIWHDIEESRIKPHEFIAIVEIPMGSKVKYELDKETGALKMDRILHTSTHYPANYGFIPRTFADDGDPLDVLILCTEKIHPMVEVHCYPIGMFQMEDEMGVDEKIIAVPFADPVYNGYRDINLLPNHVEEEMRHFFSVYKALEGKKSIVGEIGNYNKAVEAIRRSMEMYKDRFATELDK